MSDENCIFCKIVAGDIPSDKIFETDRIFAFMDISPLSEGHCLFIPKAHAERMDQIGEETLAEILPAMAKTAKALGLETYNILQNNGKLAHQEVMHAHFHLIPKTSSDDGLAIKWSPITGADQASSAEKIRGRL